MLKNILNIEGAQKLSKNEQKDIMGGKVAPLELQAWMCCSNSTHACGTCVSSSGIPTCSSGYTVTAC